MNVEILGEPKTVRLEGNYKGETFSAPFEVWIMALVSVLDSEQMGRFFETLKQVQESGEYKKVKRARVVADIPMPDIKT